MLGVPGFQRGLFTVMQSQLRENMTNIFCCCLQVPDPEPHRQPHVVLGRGRGGCCDPEQVHHTATCVPAPLHHAGAQGRLAGWM
jgi:hypothetical protein